MKFLLVSPFTGASGSAIRFWNIAQALRERGHRVVYSDRIAKHTGPLHSCEGITYYGCPSSGVLALDILISFVFSMCVFIRHIDCTVFYALKPAPNNCIPALAARLLGKKIILDVDDLDYAYLKGGPARTVFRLFFDLFPRFFHLVTYHTPKLREYLSAAAHVPAGKLYYCAQGVSPAFCSPCPDAPAAVSSLSLIYVATLGITSDFDDLIPGLQLFFARFPQAWMSVVGDGCRKTEFERAIGNAGIADRVRFAGTIDHAALPRFVAGHRIGINYLRRSPVNECRAILKIREYLACGLDVVCNDVGDVELFKGYIRICPTVESMFAAVAGICARPPQRNVAGREFIERNYRWSAIVADFLRRLETL